MNVPCPRGVRAMSPFKSSPFKSRSEQSFEPFPYYGGPTLGLWTDNV